MNIKDIDKISTSPRKGKKGFLKKLLDLTKGGESGGETNNLITIEGDITVSAPDVITQYVNVTYDEFIKLCKQDKIPQVNFYNMQNRYGTFVEEVYFNDDDKEYSIGFVIIGHGNSGGNPILANLGSFSIYVNSDDNDIHLSRTH